MCQVQLFCNLSQWSNFHPFHPIRGFVKMFIFIDVLNVSSGNSMNGKIRNKCYKKLMLL